MEEGEEGLWGILVMEMRAWFPDQKTVKGLPNPKMAVQPPYPYALVLCQHEEI